MTSGHSTYVPVYGLRERVLPPNSDLILENAPAFVADFSLAAEVSVAGGAVLGSRKGRPATSSNTFSNVSCCLTDWLRKYGSFTLGMNLSHISMQSPTLWISSSCGRVISLSTRIKVKLDYEE